MGEVLQDKAGEPQTGQAGPRRRVSSPSAPTGQGPARRAQSTRARPLQLLRRPRQLSASAAARRSHEAGVVPMAVPSQPAHALDVGEVWRRAPAVPSPPPTDDGPHLGRRATSHINGRAGGWKSPCPDSARGRGGNLLAYSTTAFLAPPPRARRAGPPTPPGGSALGQGAARRSAVWTCRSGWEGVRLSGMLWATTPGRAAGIDLCVIPKLAAVPLPIAPARSRQETFDWVA